VANLADDQVAADDEKDIHAEETTLKGGQPGVEQQHREHGQRAQAIDILPERRAGERSFGQPVSLEKSAGGSALRVAA
jgi:hypothetical protein